MWHFRVTLLGGFVYVYKLLTLEKASYLTVFILHIHCYMYNLCLFFLILFTHLYWSIVKYLVIGLPWWRFMCLYVIVYEILFFSKKTQFIFKYSPCYSWTVYFIHCQLLSTRITLLLHDVTREIPTFWRLTQSLLYYSGSPGVVLTTYKLVNAISIKVNTNNIMY